MFSKMIQNLLSSSGKSAAMQRYATLNSQVEGLKNRTAEASPMDTLYPKNRVNNDPNSFENILKTSNPVNIVKNPSVSSLNTTIQELGSTNSVTATSSKSQILDMITKISEKHGVDDKLVKALIRQESGFNPKATSKSGAMGLMQLMPATAKGLGVQDAYNPVQNVEGGVKYLKSMLNRYNGNIILALAAYNAGPGAVDKYSGVPPYAETQNYVKNILANYL